MAISRAKKEELVSEYKEHIANASAMILTNYRGLSVARIRDLRAKLNVNGATYVVIKNSLFALALDAVERPRPDNLLDGPNGVVFLGEDIGSGAQSFKDWLKTDTIVEIKGGILETSILDSAAVDVLAALPTKEQTKAMLLGALSGPARGIVSVINAPGSSLVRVINARKNQLQDAE